MNPNKWNSLSSGAIVAITMAAAGCANEGGMAMRTDKTMAMSALSAHVALAPTAGNSINGNLELEPMRHDVHLSGFLSGFVPGSVHGFHVHEKGDCSAPDGSSAGGHFNPGGVAHGNPSSPLHHAGDMTNISADAQRMVKVNVLLKDVSLGTGAGNDIIGRAIVIHGAADDYTSQPSGNSGLRVACGVIEKGGVSH
ncbi:MAG: superoxide dismutase family protein [Lysobacteraceae bacterium]